MINISHMFHDDTIETKTFILSSESEVYYVEIDSEYLIGLRSQIETAIASDKGYIDVRHLNLIYKGRLFDDQILEVTWD